MKKITIICLFALITANGFSQTFNSKRLDSLFTLLEKNNKYMGSIAISENGKTIYTKSIGFDDAAASKKSDINTKYRIGSISKIFTASLIFKAVEENKINLNQTIEKYFPTIKNAKTITISNLLNHRSGIHDFTNDDSYFDWNTQYQSRDKMIERIASGEIAFEPDSKGEYSNSNYVLLTYILEHVYKNQYAEILNQKIIKPLKLKNTYFGGKINTNNKESYSYSYSGEWKKSTETDISIPQGAGGIVSTPVDLNYFIESLFAGKIISAEHLNLMKTIKDKFGMGMFEFPYLDKKVYGHTGGIDRFKSVSAYLPQEKLAVAFCSNGKDYDNNNVLLCALSSYFNNPFTMPNFNIVQVPAQTLNLYSGTYSSLQIPFKINISQKDNTLIAQADGQSSFPLESTSVNIFKFDTAGIVLEFNSEKNEMNLKQGGKEYLFKKE
ncbi:CubicO group peptidase (beta-lactamase class C family) [Flavobacterium sp. HSC-32F16]|uniref:serine hydrolase domain-containing protein n=1 Tax=Flavobacterium sp. HSC-32F16 TaxID=2910964 RepID=UPI0020A2C182|nr:serine hydrolase domain-containing protein [Flavobacterium sp. HSC-32F16]MCP2025914.1 CubicO group peptidase (beta-lactamase class C family) [Flavobacterium sp. HSC-32F16]